MLATILRNYGTGKLEVQCEEAKKFKTNIIEIKEVTKSYQTYLLLNRLYHLFIKTLSKEEGHSEVYWKYFLKQYCGFGDVIRNGNGQGYDAFSPWTFSYDNTTHEQRSKLFSDSFMYVKENQIFDTAQFEKDYFEITGHCLTNI